LRVFNPCFTPRQKIYDLLMFCEYNIFLVTDVIGVNSDGISINFYEGSTNPYLLILLALQQLNLIFLSSICFIRLEVI